MVFRSLGKLNLHPAEARFTPGLQLYRADAISLGCVIIGGCRGLT